MKQRLPGIESPTHDPWLAQALEAVPTLIRQLEPDEQYVVLGYFYEQRGVWELARELECLPERVVTLLRTSVRTLRRQLSP